MNTTEEHVSTNSTMCGCNYATSLTVALVSNSINLILGCPTNGYVLWLIFRGAGGTLASEFFTLNLTVNEILSCVYNVAMIIWIKRQSLVFLIIMSFFSGFLTVGRPLFQTCICLERYLAVVHPVVFLRYKPLRYRLACSALVWMFVIVLSAFVEMSLSFIWFFSVLYLVVLLVHLFCCLSVLRALKRPGPGEGEREGSSDFKRRAFKIILLILIAMLVTYLPFTITSLVQDVLCVNCFFFAFNICVSITTVCGCILPLLYLYRVGKCPCLNLVF